MHQYLRFIFFRIFSNRMSRLVDAAENNRHCVVVEKIMFTVSALCFKLAALNI